MVRGKKVCKILKEIRRQIADKNDIEYITSECHYQGECKGTCPKCEAEVRYLENELLKQKQLGKTACIAGISLGIAGTFSACNVPQQRPDTPSEQEIISIMPAIEIVSDEKEADFEIVAGMVKMGEVMPFHTDTIRPIEEDIEIIKDEK